MRTVGEWFAAWPRLAAGLRERSPETIAHTRLLATSFERRFGRRLLDGFEGAGAECLAWAGDHPQHVRFARTIMADAVLLGYLESSPLKGARYAPRAHRGEFVPSWDEVLGLADEGEAYGLRSMVLVAACCGGRLSALAGLERSHVAVSEHPGLLRVSLACKRREGRYETMLLRPGSRELMVVAPEVGRLFSRPEGGAWCRRSVSRVFVKMRRALDLPEACTFHSLRKHYATTLLDRGVSELDVAFALDHVDAAGRPNPELVRRIYGRPSRDEALARIARAA